MLKDTERILNDKGRKVIDAFLLAKCLFLGQEVCAVKTVIKASRNAALVGRKLSGKKPNYNFVADPHESLVHAWPSFQAFGR